MSEGHHSNAASSSSSSETQLLFQTVFNRLVSCGEPPNSAAAKALLTLQEHMSINRSKVTDAVKETVTEKVDIEVEGGKNNSDNMMVDLHLRHTGVFTGEQTEKRTHSVDELKGLLTTCAAANDGSGDFSSFGEA